jgi:hypothetical protein
MPTKTTRHIQANMHLIMGYVFLGLVFMGAISSVYYWEYKAKVSAAERSMMVKHVESGEQSPEVQGVTCDNALTRAKQRETGEVREFPSPCHVDLEWWEIIKN